MPDEVWVNPVAKKVVPGEDGVKSLAKNFRSNAGASSTSAKKVMPNEENVRTSAKIITTDAENVKADED